MAAFWLDPVRATQEISLSLSGKQTAAEEDWRKGAFSNSPAHPALINVCARGEALHRDDLSVVPFEVKGSLNSPRCCRGRAKSHALLSPGLFIPVGCTCPCPAGVGSVLVACVSGAIVARRGKITSPFTFLRRACSIPAGMNHLTPISKEFNVAAFGRDLFSVSVRDPRSTSVRG